MGSPSIVDLLLFAAMSLGSQPHGCRPEPDVQRVLVGPFAKRRQRELVAFREPVSEIGADAPWPERGHRSSSFRAPPKLITHYAIGLDTASTGYGGFDNDAKTLTSIMRNVLGGIVPFPPRPEELTGY